MTDLICDSCGKPIEDDTHIVATATDKETGVSREVHFHNDCEIEIVDFHTDGTVQ